MGPTKAALAADRLVNKFLPSTVVNIGIAGSMSHDLLIGDVIVAEQADDYLYESKAVPSDEGNGFDFKLSGDPYKTSKAYVEHAKNLKFAHVEDVDSWCCFADGFLRSCLTDTDRFGLLQKKLLREKPAMVVGRLASSTVVGADQTFVKWLKDKDRKYGAIEMEAAGTLCAVHGRPTETLIIRGVSDFSDHRKEQTDGVGDGGLRRYAMANALEMLLTFMKLALLERR
jgi:nucleoside phosphorylase